MVPKRTRRTATGTLAALVAAGALLLGSVACAQATETSRGPSQEQVAQLKAPCLVTGYSYHAQQEMAADGISSDYVEQVVHDTCGSAKRQGNGNWRFQTRYITVITNNNGYVVTVWRN